MVAPKPVLSPAGREQLKHALKRLKNADAVSARRHLDAVIKMHPQCVEAWLLRGMLVALTSGSADTRDLAHAADLAGASLDTLQDTLQHLAASRDAGSAALKALPGLVAALSAPAQPGSEAPWRRLFSAFERCHGRRGAWIPFVEPSAVGPAASAFKADVSFIFGAGRHARFSVNDKLEAEAFRERLLREKQHLGLAARQLEAFFSLAAPGEVQTTLGLKYLADAAVPDRVSLYLEELGKSPRGAALRSATFGLLGLRAPAIPSDFDPNAVCIDYRAGRAVGAKCYDVTLERQGTSPPPLPAALDALRSKLPWHPRQRTRRYMLTARVDANGAAVGAKLLYMTEVHDRAHARLAFEFADTLVDETEPVDGSTHAAYADLRTDRPQEPHYYYPDLIGMNVDAAGTVQSVVVHVSVR